MNDKVFTLAVFIVTYVLIAAAKKNNVIILACACALLFLKKIVTFSDIPHIVNANVLGIFIGTMTLSVFFSESKAPEFIAHRILARSARVWQAMLLLCILAGAISSFMENVIVVFLMAPIALEVAKKIKASPVPFLIGIAVSSNLQGTATMIGDSPSMIMATYGGMNFLDFFWMPPALTHKPFGLPGITWAVELGACASFVVLYYVFRKNNHALDTNALAQKPVRIKTLFPSAMIALMVISLVFASFFKKKIFLFQPGGICLSYGLAMLVANGAKRWISTPRFLKECDWHTLSFLIGIFILVGSLTTTGIVDDIARFIVSALGGRPFLVYSMLVWVSVFASGFIDNIPYALAIVPVIFKVTGLMGISPYPFLFGSFIGMCLGGNITPIGAQANIAAVGFLRKHGYRVSFFDFAKIGFPFTIAAVSVAYVAIWLLWRI
jgi:Na+/H+ antiporter NhaD/arsenite permease-like protein